MALIFFLFEVWITNVGVPGKSKPASFIWFVDFDLVSISAPFRTFIVEDTWLHGERNWD